MSKCLNRCWKCWKCWRTLKSCTLAQKSCIFVQNSLQSHFSSIILLKMEKNAKFELHCYLVLLFHLKKCFLWSRSFYMLILFLKFEHWCKNSNHSYFLGRGETWRKGKGVNFKNSFPKDFTEFWRNSTKVLKKSYISIFNFF